MEAELFKQFFKKTSRKVILFAFMMIIIASLMKPVGAVISNELAVTQMHTYNADIANFAMIEFMYPSIPGAKYIPTDNGACDIAGFSINEIRNFGK